MQILPHTIVRARRGTWRVVDVRAFDDCELVTLCGAAPPHLGAERRLLRPFDRLEPVERRSAPRRVDARRWRRRCRALLGADTPPGCLRTAARARFDLWPYQLEPALAIVRGAGCRLLLADEVGLGKTIQSGLVVAELLARSATDRVLILTPAGVRDQWRTELRERFRLDAAVADARAVREAAATLPSEVNPWSTWPLVVASLDYVKRPEVLPAASARPWDLVIVDEAHGAAADSDRHAAAHALCASASYVLLLTATPHSGDERAFRSLCGIGAVDGVPPIVFRRTREDAGLPRNRRVRRLPVRPTTAEREMRRLLRAYGAAVLAERPDAALAWSVLRKRALSSAAALADSVDRRIAALDEDESLIAGEQLALPLDAAGELTSEDEPAPWPERLALVDRTRERRLLASVSTCARAAAAGESKLSALVRLLRRVPEPALVFTEYRDTQRYVERALRGASLGRTVLLLHGGMSEYERRAAVAAFAHEPRAILLATDAAAEGVNLQSSCRFVVNVELPWNPTRLEQRIGRVDRIGQRRLVHAVHLVARGSEEMGLLDRLRTRVADAQAAIGAANPVDDLAEPASAMSTVAFRDAAILEAERVSQARRLLCGATADPDAELRPTMTRARGRTRARLRGRTLEIWRVAAVDASGRRVESHIVALLVGDGATATAETAARAAATWLEESRRTHGAFGSTRLERDRAIARLHGAAIRPLQRGLFDRRADRAHEAAAADQIERREHVARRIALGGTGATIALGQPELVLVLTA